MQVSLDELSLHQTHNRLITNSKYEPEVYRVVRARKPVFLFTAAGVNVSSTSSKHVLN